MTNRLALTLALLPSLALAAITTGPAVGTKLPDFSAADQDNRTHTLSSLLGPKGAVVVIYRSADW
jgi:hypothetical protein